MMNIAERMQANGVEAGIFKGATTAALVVVINGPNPPAQPVTDAMTARLTEALITKLNSFGLQVATDDVDDDRVLTGETFLLECVASGSWTAPRLVSYIVDLTTHHLVASPLPTDTDDQGNRRMFHAIGYHSHRTGSVLDMTPTMPEVETQLAQAIDLLTDGFRVVYQSANP